MDVRTKRGRTKERRRKRKLKDPKEARERSEAGGWLHHGVAPGRPAPHHTSHRTWFFLGPLTADHHRLHLQHTTGAMIPPAL